MDLNNKKVSLKLRRTYTGKNLSCLSVGVMCSDFLLPDKILAARLRANGRLATFSLLVPAQTEEQQNNLLKTNAFTVQIKEGKSNRWRILLIAQNFPERSGTKALVWSLNEKVLID